MRLNPMRRGFASAFGVIAVIASLLILGAGVTLDAPSAELLWMLGQAGVGLLIAYSVAVTRGEKRLSRKGTRDRHEDWLGFVAGVGVCGLIGIGVAFATASHREAGYASLLDEIGLWWSVGSIGMLGVIVAILPIMSYEWRRNR